MTTEAMVQAASSSPPTRSYRLQHDAFKGTSLSCLSKSQRDLEAHTVPIIALTYRDLIFHVYLRPEGTLPIRLALIVKVPEVSSTVETLHPRDS